MAIESKSFDFEIVGIKEDLLRISENGRGRRFSLLLPNQVSQWLLRASGRFCKSKSSSWFNQLRLGFGRFLLGSKRNRAGKFLQLFAIKKGQRYNNNSKKSSRISGVWQDPDVHDLTPMCTRHIKRSVPTDLQKTF